MASTQTPSRKKAKDAKLNDLTDPPAADDFGLDGEVLRIRKTLTGVVEVSSGDEWSEFVKPRTALIFNGDLADVFTPMQTWLDGASAIYTSSYSSVQFYDPVSGDDGNVGDRRDRPKKTFPTALSANTAYLIKGGTTVSPTNRLDLTSAGNTYIGSYDHGAYGKATISGAANTGDPTRTIRVAAPNVIIENLRIGQPTPGSGSRTPISQATAGTNLTVRYCDFLLDNASNSPIAELVAAPFDFSYNNVIGGNQGIAINVPTSAMSGVTTPSYFRGNKVALNPAAAFAADADGLTIGVTCDWNYLLIIEGNDVSGFAENGFDINKGSRVVVRYNHIHDPVSLGGQDNIGIFLGQSAGGTSKTMVYGNRINGLNKTASSAAINARGCSNGLVVSNLIYDCSFGIINGVAGSNGNKYIHNTIFNCTTALRIADSTTYVVAMNNILHGQNVYDVGNAGANCVVGGNAICGTFSGIYAPVTSVWPDNIFESRLAMVNDFGVSSKQVKRMVTVPIAFSIPNYDRLSQHRFGPGAYDSMQIGEI